MDKEKQIEKMAKIIGETTFRRGFEYYAAAGIFAAGYGNVKEAVKEFAELVKIAFHYEFNDLIPAPILSKKIDELIKEVCGEK